MPTYEYSCPKCGEFEITQRITDQTLKKCPTCKSKVQKLISSTSFQLKGSGWYVTDYGGKKKAPATETGAAKESGGKESSASGEGASKSASGETKSKDPAPAPKKEPAANAA
jgi:putative FmdB family regulatory protein